MAVEHVDEETALLTNNKNVKKRTPTPLPKVQIYILMVLQICEPVTSQSIYPYINQLISELDITGGDERKVGYYAGLIESLFFVTEAMTVLQWSRTSDQVGRKPILLIGLAGTIISMLCFGLSTTFWALVVSRCLTGLLNGNIGVMKSTIGDLTDSSNRAEGIAMLPVVWSLGATLGPLIGGTFAKPHERFPKLFTATFWRDFPYFLPCLVTSSYVFVAFLATLFIFKESAPKIRKRRSRPPSTASSSSSDYQAISIPANGNETNQPAHDGPLPLRELLTYPVVISISNYVALAFLNIAFNALLPLFLAMPLEIGGLDQPPSTIGYVMGGYGAATGIYQFFFFAKVNRYLGEKKVFLAGMASLPAIFILFPVISLIAKQWGVGPLAWTVLVLVMMLAVIMDMAYGAIFLYVTASAPNKSSLGATNGLSQMIVSISRAIGPAMATSLFSLSVQENWLGGYAVYILLFVLGILSLFLAAKLPDQVWEEAED